MIKINAQGIHGSYGQYEGDGKSLIDQIAAVIGEDDAGRLLGNKKMLKDVVAFSISTGAFLVSDSDG